MKLSNIFPQIMPEKIQSKKDRDVSSTSATSSPTPGADRVELSSQSADIQRMREIIDSTPAVRAERVQELKGLIARGEYTIDPQKIADKMLQGLLEENFPD